MIKNDEFKNFHPIVNFVYFVGVIAFSVLLMNPVYIVISLIISNIYGVFIKGISFFKIYKWSLPVAIFAALINPIFNHQGMTVLLYTKSGNPLTLEAIVFGIFAGIMLLSVISWFECYNNIMTSDKFIYLFGKTIPSISLAFSMILRFVPRLLKETEIIIEGQKCLGKWDDKSIRGRIKSCVSVIKIMILWSLENSIEISDNMNARGYGLKGRTTFSIYKFRGQDIIALVSLLILSTYIIFSLIPGVSSFNYYPQLSLEFDLMPEIFVYALFLMTPVTINILEGIRWKIYSK